MNTYSIKVYVREAWIYSKGATYTPFNQVIEAASIKDAVDRVEEYVQENFSGKNVSITNLQIKDINNDWI